MEKKILIAVDDSIHSRRAIEYCIDMCSIIKGMHYVLINILPKISDFLLHEAKTDPKASAVLKEIAVKNRKDSIRILDESMEIMLKLGVDKKLIEKVSLHASKGTAKAILDYAKQSHCHAIVVGNRGKSKFTEAFTGSIANNIIEHTKVTPVWAVGGDIKTQKVMLAVDGSESSLKAVKHAAFMLAGNIKIDITLIHVAPKLRDYCAIDFDKKSDMMEEIIKNEDKKCVESFYVHAKKRFMDAGLDEKQLHVLEVKSKISIGKTIVNNAKKHGCGTLVIGKTGADDSFFMGNVSWYVITNAKDCTVWLVP